MNFQAPESLSEQIAQHLGSQIIKGSLKPKERIQELKIAKELDVSRGSVREALLILERRHLINIFPRRGAVVSELSPHLVSALYDMYIHLVMMLCTKLANKWQGEDLKPVIDQLKVINRVSSDTKHDIDYIIDSGFELLNRCQRIVDNPYLFESMENFRPAVTRTYYLAVTRRADELSQTMRFYNDIVVSIKERDQTKINRIIKVYGEHQKALILEVLKEIADAAAFISK